MNARTLRSAPAIATIACHDSHTQSVRGWRLYVYALPNLSISMLVMPIATIVPALYVKERGVALATMGVVLMAARIIDAVADQVVGFLSDLTRDRIAGGRKAWLVLGGLIASPSVYLLCVPPANAGIVHFTIWSLAAYLAWAMLLIPYTAWGAELSRGYHERTHIMTVRSVAGQFGILLFLGTPIVLPWLGLAPNTETNLHSARYVATALIVLIPATILPAILLVPQGVRNPLAPRVDVMSTLRALWANRPMRIYASAFLVSEIGYGIFVSLFFIFIDAYLGLGSRFAHVVIIGNLATLLSLPLWQHLSRALGKKEASALAWFLQGMSFFSLALVPRGEDGFVMLTVMMTLNMILGGSAHVLAPSILGDIVDYDTLKTGGYRAGNYFALYTLTIKIVVALGGGLALVLLGLSGYDVAHPAANSAREDAAMLWIFIGAPGVLRLASLALLWFYPLDARSQNIIRQRLEQREARARLAQQSIT